MHLQLIVLGSVGHTTILEQLGAFSFKIHSVGLQQLFIEQSESVTHFFCEKKIKKIDSAMMRINAIEIKIIFFFILSLFSLSHLS